MYRRKEICSSNFACDYFSRRAKNGNLLTYVLVTIIKLFRNVGVFVVVVVELEVVVIVWGNLRMQLQHEGKKWFNEGGNNL